MFLGNEYANRFLTRRRSRFTGTFLFLFMAFATTQVANASSSGSGGQDNGITQVPNASALTYIALGFGFSLAVNAWVFFRVSGGLFNPAVTLGMALIGAIGWIRGILIFLAQILGSMAAAGVVLATFPGPMNVSTTLGGGTSVVQGLCEYHFPRTPNTR
jgi:aquaporin related protein